MKFCTFSAASAFYSLLKLVSHRLAVRADLERSLKTRLLMHSESLAGAEEEDQEDKVAASLFDLHKLHANLLVSRLFMSLPEDSSSACLRLV